MDLISHFSIFTSHTHVLALHMFANSHLVRQHLQKIPKKRINVLNTNIYNNKKPTKG